MKFTSNTSTNILLLSNQVLQYMYSFLNFWGALGHCEFPPPSNYSNISSASDEKLWELRFISRCSAKALTCFILFLHTKFYFLLITAVSFSWSPLHKVLCCVCSWGLCGQMQSWEGKMWAIHKVLWHTTQAEHITGQHEETQMLANSSQVQKVLQEEENIEKEREIQGFNFTKS